MATPARRSLRARRPFAVVEAAEAAPSTAVNGATSEENVENNDGMSFSQCLGRFRKFSGEAKPDAAGKKKTAAKKCSSSPVSSKKAAVAAASRAPRTESRRRVKCSTPAAARAAYDAPRAPLWDYSEEAHKVRARLSSPCDEPENGRQGGGISRKRRTTTRSVALEEAMAGLPEAGEGRVRYLVDTFERLLSLSGDPDEQGRVARRRKKTTPESAAKTGSPPTKAEEIDMSSYPSIASSSEASFPINGSSRRSSARDGRPQRRCNSIGSSERSRRRKAIGVTSQHPFNLRTEQRGKIKEESFVQRMMNRLQEEERMRYPVAQGLPWTTDEPENPVKPPTKEPTEPIDVVLHSEVRAVGRARFDHQVAERSSFLEKLNLERERQQKMDEEIEIKQLRKELVPRAHPMPDFSKPFVPKRSVKPQTVPKEPRFHPRLTRPNSKTEVASFRDSSFPPICARKW